VQQLGGAIARVPAADTAFPDRSAPYVLNAVVGWHDPAQADAHIGWARKVIEAAADASTGHAYVNFLGDAGAGRSAYDEETYSRLLALKREYDPTNVFARNQNIDPQAGS
jgi:FAD/FMN-containing dehydrogenase